MFRKCYLPWFSLGFCCLLCGFFGWFLSFVFWEFEFAQFCFLDFLLFFLFQSLGFLDSGVEFVNTAGGVYEPLLADCGVWVPLDQTWLRLEGEVITRMLEKVTRASDPDTPEAAAKWAQAEAEDIAAGRK